MSKDGCPTRVVEVKFRWPVEQVGDKQVIVKIPSGAFGIPVIDPRFAEEFKLSDKEYEAAEYAALAELVVVK